MIENICVLYRSQIIHFHASFYSKQERLDKSTKLKINDYVLSGQHWCNYHLIS